MNWFKTLIDKYGVDLVLQGHDHTYARGYASNKAEETVVEDSGAVYAVSVSGPKMYESQDQDWMVRRAEYTSYFKLSPSLIHYQVRIIPQWAVYTMLLTLKKMIRVINH